MLGGWGWGGVGCQLHMGIEFLPVGILLQFFIDNANKGVINK